MDHGNVQVVHLHVVTLDAIVSTGATDTAVVHGQLVELPLPVHLLHCVQQLGLIVVMQHHLLLDLLPLVINVLQPGEEETTVVPGANVAILLLLLQVNWRVDFLVTKDVAHAAGKRLVGQTSGTPPMHPDDFLLHGKHKLLLF